jgi:hypothetical protein
MNEKRQAPYPNNLEIFDVDPEQLNAFQLDIYLSMVQFHKTKDGMWLFEAIRACAQYGEPIPAYVREHFDNALQRYATGEAWSLDDAFQVSRPKNKKQPAHQNKQRYAQAIWLEVRRLHNGGKGMPIDESLFQDIAKRHVLSWSSIRNYYREYEAFMQKERALADADSEVLRRLGRKTLDELQG